MPLARHGTVKLGAAVRGSRREMDVWRDASWIKAAETTDLLIIM